jgi:hypothetical protein
VLRPGGGHLVSLRGRIRAGAADGLANPWLTPLGIKTQDPAGQVCSTPSRVKVTVPSRT